MLPLFTSNVFQDRLKIIADTIYGLLARIHDFDIANSVQVTLQHLSKMPRYYYFIASFLLIFFLYMFLQLTTRKKYSSKGLSEPLQALSIIIVPTNCTWPQEYAPLLSHSICIQSRTLSINLSHLMQNIYSGLVELREINDLPELLRGRMKVYGWRMTFYSDLHLWIRIGSWIIFSNLPILWYAGPKLETHLLQSVRKQVSLSGKTFCGTAFSSFNVPMSVYTLDLDYVPYQYIQSSIQKTLSSLQSGTSLIINFTTIQRATAYLDEQFVLCAIPFLPRKYGNSHTKNKHVRTAIPLYLTLPHALEVISDVPNTTVHSVANASRERALSLQAWEQLLVHDRKLRSAYVDENGIESWREHRFLLAWEAGLLTAEFLICWQVVIQKQ